MYDAGGRVARLGEARAVPHVRARRRRGDSARRAAPSRRQIAPSTALESATGVARGGAVGAGAGAAAGEPPPPSRRPAASARAAASAAARIRSCCPARAARLFCGLRASPRRGTLEIGRRVLQRRELRVELGRGALLLGDLSAAASAAASRLVGALLGDSPRAVRAAPAASRLVRAASRPRCGRRAPARTMSLRLLAELRRPCRAVASRPSVSAASTLPNMSSELRSRPPVRARWAASRPAPHLRDLGDRVGLVGLRTERALALGRLVARVDRLPPRLVGHLRRLHRGVGGCASQARPGSPESWRSRPASSTRSASRLLDLAPARVVGRGGARRRAARRPTDAVTAPTAARSRTTVIGLRPRDRRCSVRLLSQG